MVTGDARFASMGALVLAVVASLWLAFAAGAAEARTTVKATLAQAGFDSRLVVTITNTRRFTVSTRPRSVTIRYGRRSYRLRRAARPARARSGARVRATSTWRSPARRAFNRLLGKRVRVIVRTRAGMRKYLNRSYRRRLARPKPRFEPPARPVKGEEAFTRIRRYFVNSRFTNCLEGWPACSTERRFDHCAGGGMQGNWQSRTFPPDPLSAADGQYRVLTASQQTDGTWGITYEVVLGSGQTAYYSWIVRPDTTVTGIYAVGQETGFLRDFAWQQPAGC